MGVLALVSHFRLVDVTGFPRSNTLAIARAIYFSSKPSTPYHSRRTGIRHHGHIGGTAVTHHGRTHGYFFEHKPSVDGANDSRPSHSPADSRLSFTAPVTALFSKRSYPAFFSDSSALIREAKRGLDAPKDRCPTVSLLEPALSHQKTGQARQNNKPNRKCVRLAQVSSCCLPGRGTTLYIAAQGTQLASEARATFRVVDAATAHFSTCYPYEGPKGDYSNGPATRG